MIDLEKALRNCPFCDTTPDAGMDSESLAIYIRCTNNACKAKPMVWSSKFYGTVDSCVNRLAPEWNGTEK